MENKIHPTAVIDPMACIGTGNYIGPYSLIGPGVVVGHNNRIEGHCSIGMPAEHKDYFKSIGSVQIGDNNTIREFTTINSSTNVRTTKMGNRCVMLRGSHLSHDSQLADDVTLSCNVLVGGETIIMRGANLGLGSIVHQRQVIGAYAMLGMGTIVTKKNRIFPGIIYVGNPARTLKDNDIGLLRARVTLEMLEKFDEEFCQLRDIPYEVEDDATA